MSVFPALGIDVILATPNSIKRDNPNVNIYSQYDYTINSFNLERKMLKDINDNHNIYIATDSIDNSDYLYNRIIDKTNLSEEDIVLINSSNSSYGTAQKFLKNPDEYIKTHKPRAVIVSPAVTSGISIETPNYFYQAYCYYSGNIKAPKDCIQQMLRVRDISIINVALSHAYKSVDLYNESARYIKAVHYKEHFGSLEKQISNTDNFRYTPKGDDSLSFDEDLSLDFNPSIDKANTLNAKTQALHNQQMNNFGNAFVGQL